MSTADEVFQLALISDGIGLGWSGFEQGSNPANRSALDYL